MGLLVKIAVVVLLISFVVFVLFFGRIPALRKTPIGALHRLLWIHIPRRMLALDQRLTNGRVYASTSRLLRYFMHDRHPTVLILFICLMAIPEIMFLPKVLPTLTLKMEVLVTIVVLCPYIFLYLSAAVDPGYVLKENLDIHGSLYPYDHNLFVPGHVCKTCRQAKPARSKHCSICGYCVSKADHHCIFINGCVGYGNHHWFLLLLFTTAILTSTGAWLGGVYTLNLITSTWSGFTFQGHGLSWSEYFTFWSWAMATEPGVASVALLCFLTTPLVWGLYLYSTYLVYRGMTTNESGKWSDFQLDIADGYIFRRTLPLNRQPDRRMEPEVLEWPKSNKFYYARAYHEPPVSTADLPGEGPWQKGGEGWTLADVDNIYDIGFVGNMMDIFLPRKYLATYTGSGATSSH